MKAPCYGCQDRRLGCHAQCDTYSAWKAEMNSNTDAVRKEYVGYRIQHRKRESTRFCFSRGNKKVHDKRYDYRI